MATLQTEFPVISLATAGTYATTAIDVQRSTSAGFTFTLAGSTSPTVDCYVECSNAVPPSENFNDNGWAPPSGSWFQAYSGGVAITDTMTGDGVLPLAVGPDGLLFRWVRAKVVTASPYVGAAMTINVTTK
jgi:hypothetical protein